MKTMSRLVILLAGIASAAINPVHAQAVSDVQEVSSSSAIEGVAAIVNDEVITFTDVRNRAQLILLSLGVQPNEQTIQQAQQRAVDGLIDEHVQLQEAEKWEVVISDSEVDDSLSRLARGNGLTTEEFIANLANQGIQQSTLRSQMKADMAWQRLVGGRYGSRVRVSDLQITDRLDRLRQSLDEEQIRVSEIFLPAYGDEQKAQMLQGAWDLRRQIQEGAPFGLVARQFSAAPTASSGGELGWLTKGQLKTELADAVLDLAPPAISEPVVTDDGIYLIALIDRRQPVEPTLEGLRLQELIASGPQAEGLLREAAGLATGCNDLKTTAEGVSGVSHIDLGVMGIGEIGLAYQAMFTETAEGQSTDILPLSGDRAAMIYVCERVMTGDQLPSRDDLEENLREQQISMLADRYLRDLKRSATIIRR